MIRQDDGYRSEGVANIKQMLPRQESLEVDGSTIRVDNGWLHELLDSYVSENGKRERVQKLDQLTERLKALESHLKRRDAAADQDGNPRDQLKSILSRAEYREKSEGPVNALIKKVRNKLIELLREIYEGIRSRVGGSTTAGWILKGLVVIAISGAVFLIVKAGFRRRVKKKSRAKVTVLGEEIEEGATPAELTAAAFSAARTGDFRTAIRKLYIALLYELGERGIVELEPNTTNHEYLTRVAQVSALAAPMVYLTDRFDYFWYGMYPSSSDDFSNYLDRYREAVARVRGTPGQPA